MELLTISLIAFVLSFVFALGGIGGAVLLVPILTMLGVPFESARPAGLFTNVLSTSAGIINNLRNSRIDWKLAIPLTLTSTLSAPIGAYLSHVINPKWVGILFTVFLFYVGTLIYIPKKAEEIKEEAPLWLIIAVGSFAGLLSGLLGIGGGSVVSPLLMFYGLNPQRIISSVIVMVPFSSLVGFITYLKLGSVEWSITLASALPAFFAGYIGTHVAHNYLNPKQIKKILGILFYIVGIKFLTKWL